MIISYGQALKFGWAIGWRVVFGSAVAGFSLGVVFVVAGHLAPLAQVLLWFVYFALGFLVVLPNAIQEAVLSSYSDFSVRVARPTERAEALNYFEALQISALTVVIYLGLGLVARPLHLQVSAGLARIAFWAFVVFPAIAAAAVHLPFRGFRITLVPGSRSR